MNWNWYQPVHIAFGGGAASGIAEIIAQKGKQRPALVCDSAVLRCAAARELLAQNHFVGIFPDIRPNPTLANVNDCAAFLRETSADCVVALGGGSVLDCAKAAAALPAADDISDYADGAKAFDSPGLPLLAVPSTAGTGSEVTCIAVLSDEANGRKAPLASPYLYPAYAVVDPLMTLSVPPKVTAESGMDALSHALEAMWSVHHNPVSDAVAARSARLILEHLEAACMDGQSIAARTAMSEGALLAGIAFSQARTAGVHACSYPLTMAYGLSHGAACAFTLAAFARRFGGDIAPKLGCKGANALAEKIHALCGVLRLPRTLGEAGIPEEALPQLSMDCHKHPMMQNNPVPMDAGAVLTLFKELR